ncbi:hypothetical protein HYW55_05185 [Candidatus Gottesmanbacteria bacterium]|nr:hypothetical protein [Candidatus Gottesmanbacteria bacterium]
MGDKKSGGGLIAFTAAVLGAVVGAGAVIFSDKTKRDKAKKEIGKLLEEGEEKVGRIRKEIQKVKNLSQKTEVKKQIGKKTKRG